ncbi:M14 family zinc carboxypeptidase [Microbacterium betulae]|uniref:M14 family zinc carboxypeptidase n=1 Tax=Microbacterium betulae TaxID=2981139 RepID=A0AA97FGC5_9MICO|nr:M14 family zinc carboxypeptidase [Microbacterium sp. AB]WOF21979.1 M14 family zinc carboxypeptidase [Microbacterium sp. AB]
MTDPDYLRRVLARVDALDPLASFPGVDALLAAADAVAAAHPDRVRRRRIGRSRLGEPIRAYSVGEGPAVVVIGGVHPNEPIGFHTALRLLSDLAEGAGPAAELPATWHIVPCIDPDGTRLNESWFSDPSDRIAYARGFYRPAPTEQVEWSFPFDYKGIVFDDPMPEAQAVMRLLDETGPALVAGLHNAELGGVYYYLSAGETAAIPALHAIAEHLEIPLDRGEPEFDGVEPLADAVYPALSSRAIVDVLDELGVEPASHVVSGGMADYAGRHDAAMFVAELPYWTHADSADASPTTLAYAEILERRARQLDELDAVLSEALDRAEPHLRIDSQLRRAAVAFVRMMPAMGEEVRGRAAREDPSRLATAAELFSNADHVRMFRLRFGSILARALRAETAAGGAAPQVRTALARLDDHLERWYDEARSVTGLRALPIERLVGVQYGTLLAVAEVSLNARGAEVPA